jgi:hypothetical protein
LRADEGKIRRHQGPGGEICVTSTIGWKLRGARALTVACGLVLTVGLLASVAGLAVASGGGQSRAVRVDVGYACKFPAATYSVSALLAAAVPASAAVGKPIQLADLQLTVRLPQAAVAYLKSLGAAAASTSGSLTSVATFRGTTVLEQWPAKSSAADALPDSGSLALVATGSAPAVTVKAPGTLTISASVLVLTLTLRTAAGAATSPASVQATCQPSGGASPQLASVVVSNAGASPNRSAPPSTKPSGERKPTFPEGCGDIPVVGIGTPVCGWITGYSDIKKLYGAVKLGPVLINIDFAYKIVIKHGDLIAYSRGRLYYPGTEPYYKGHEQFPPARATFLTFGFVPVTATTVVIEHGPINIVSVSGLSSPFPITVTATTKVSIYISGVLVNGKPLDVGGACHTASLAQLKLTGHGVNSIPPTGYTVRTGGPLTGTVAIPKFTDCGKTENLDALLTGTISGPGNYEAMIQGELCGPINPLDWFCPPPVPRLRR